MAGAVAIVVRKGRIAYLTAKGVMDLETKKVVERYSDLEIGLADASIVVLAERHAVTEVLTLDQRHFRSMRIERATQAVQGVAFRPLSGRKATS